MEVNPIRILICNRYNLFREGVKALLQAGNPTVTVAETGTASGALRLMKSFRPDVVLLDATTPDSSGSESTRLMRLIDPGVKIVVVSMNDDEPLRSGCMRAGACACVGHQDHAWRLKEIINDACGRDTQGAHGNWSIQ